MLKKYIYISLGLIFVGLAFLGVFLPGIPTTPLILLSAWFFSKLSQRLEKWLKNHKTFGPLILNWEKYRGINRKSKIVAICLIIPTFAFSIYSISIIQIKIFLGLFCVSLCSYLITRPEPPINTN